MNPRELYFAEQVPKPDGGDGKYDGKLPWHVAKTLLTDCSEKLEAVRVELDVLDEHPARLQLFKRIKESGRVRDNVRDPDAVAKAEKRAEPTKREKKVMDRFIKLIRDERSLEGRVRFLGHFVGNG